MRIGSGPANTIDFTNTFEIREGHAILSRTPRHQRPKMGGFLALGLPYDIPATHTSPL
jgi:hypothetical protein